MYPLLRARKYSRQTEVRVDFRYSRNWGQNMFFGLALNYSVLFEIQVKMGDILAEYLRVV